MLSIILVIILSPVAIVCGMISVITIYTILKKITKFILDKAKLVGTSIDKRVEK